MNRNIPFFILIVSFFSCKKNNDYHSPMGESKVPLLYKILDSTMSISSVERNIFYYNKLNLCDSIVFQKQNIGVIPVSWSNMRLWFEYNNSQQAIKVTKKEAAYPENIYCEITYNGNGFIKSFSCYSNKYNLNYDSSGKLVSDSQYNSFDIWEYVYTYEYDINRNVIKMGTKSRYDNSISYAIYTYDSAINPLYNKVDLSMPVPSPKSLSPNNVTSIGSYQTINYTYNNYNLPIKAKIHTSGSLEPLIRTFIYY